MKYDFDEVVNRRGTYAMKWDGRALFKSFMPKVRFDDETIPMMVADMDFACSPAVIKAMHRTADHGIYGYTAHLTEPRYNKAIVDWYRRRYNTRIEEDWLIYSNGSCEGVNHAIRSFSNLGEGVIICRPVYGHFTGMIENDCYRRVVNCEMINDGSGFYTMDWEAFEEACAVPANRLFVLCSPQNPVGRVWTKEELARMASICKKQGVILVSDEIHSDLVRKGVTHTTILNAVEDYSNIIMVTAVNKSFNMAGLQCSNLVIPDRKLRGIFQKGFGMRMPTPFAVAGLIAAYDDSEDWLNALNEYLDGLIDRAIAFFREKMPKVKVWRPQGTYILWLDFRGYGLTDGEIHRRIFDEANVMLQDGTAFAPETGACFQRMCVTCARSVLDTALDRIGRAFEGL